LNEGELFGGLEWLGMKMNANTVREVLKELDADGDGAITFKEFRDALLMGDTEEETEGMGNTDLSNLSVKPIPMGGGDKGHDDKEVTIPQRVLDNIKVKANKCSKFSLIWTSQGSMSRQKISVWEPTVAGIEVGLERAFRQNKSLVCVGHYAGNGYDSPAGDSKNERLILEVSDMSVSRIGSSEWLEHVLNKFMPHPVRFRLVWSVTHGSNKFYSWEPIPPSEHFVCLGMVGTNTATAPARTSMRCVPKDWCCTPESNVEERLWDDAGAGGRSGSIWRVNNMNLTRCTVGHEPPTDACYELKSYRFLLPQFSDVAVGSYGGSGGYTPPRGSIGGEEPSSRGSVSGEKEKKKKQGMFGW
jgi:hypothetical protein